MKKHALALSLFALAACAKQTVRPDPVVEAAPPAARARVATPVETLAAPTTESAPMVADVVQPAQKAPLAPPVVRFGFNSWILSAEARTALADFAAQYSGQQAPALTIEGHADERGTEEFNLVLGERRASAVRKYLAKLGLKEGMLRTISFGEARPASAGHDEGAWALNRRAEMKVTSR